MNLKAKEGKFIDKKNFDNLIGLYNKNLITYETVIDRIIQLQKRLVINDIVGEGDGIVAKEVLARRMEHVGIEVVI